MTKEQFKECGGFDFSNKLDPHYYDFGFFTSKRIPLEKISLQTVMQECYNKGFIEGQEKGQQNKVEEIKRILEI